MINGHEAAAFWGSAENKMYPLEVRLKMALQALEFFGGHYDSVESMVEDAKEEVWIVKDWGVNPNGKIELFHAGEEQAAAIMESAPGRFHFILIKSIKLPVEVE